METKNILILDDHPILRWGLKSLLNDLYPQLKVYEAEDGDSMLSCLRKRKFDVLIIDIQVPNTDTIRLVELVSIKYPNTYVLAYSMMPENIYGKRLLQAGASGYLPKMSAIDEVKRAFSIVLKRKKYISQNLLEMLAGEAVQNKSANPFYKLSTREFEIANLLVGGTNIIQIAAQLNLKPSTVGTYKTRMFEKIGITSVFQLKDLATLYNLDGMRPD
jgi:two-component system, NarL family, invasion response regulator UvrY